VAETSEGAEGERAEQGQGSEPSACGLTLPVALEPSQRFWQQRGEFVPVHDLNLWLAFLLVSLPLLTAPGGKSLLQRREEKKKPQKRRAEGCRGGSNPWSGRRGVGKGFAVGVGTPNPPTLEFPSVQASGELHGRVLVEDVPPDPQRPSSNSRSPGPPLGPRTVVGSQSIPLQAGSIGPGEALVRGERPARPEQPPARGRREQR